jgi:hypothetical protein
MFSLCIRHPPWLVVGNPSDRVHIPLVDPRGRKMGKDKPPRHVALAIVYSVSTHRILMVTSRKHAHLWICKRFRSPVRGAGRTPAHQ